MADGLHLGTPVTSQNSKRYLLVTHIPFARSREGVPMVDSLWARDLAGLRAAAGPLRVAAPEYADAVSMGTWGPGLVEMPASSGVEFAGFAPVRSRRDLWKWPGIRRVLRREVEAAGLVHTSNLFPPYLGLSYAHHLAAKLGKRTLFVIAEDFTDMLAWEWIRTAKGPIERWRRERSLRAIEARVRRCAASATLTFLHTPAAVGRYRLSARRAVAIRQPGHEAGDIIDSQNLQDRLSSLASGRPLRLVCAARHAGLKGLDMLIDACGLLERRGVAVEADFYGQGPDTERLRARVRELGLEGKIRLPGAVAPGPGLYAALSACDLFVMPHRTNDFGRAFFDAMAAALPVLAFRTPASTDTVYDGIDGFLAPLDDVQGLAERIGYLASDRETLARASHAARRRALENTRQIWFDLRAGWTNALWNE